MKKFAGDNWVFYALYLLLLAWAGYYLLNFDKVSLHRKINSMVGNVTVDTFFKYITFIGDGIFAFALVMFVAVSSIRNGLFILFSYIVSGTISSFLKNYVFSDINRPHWVFDELMHEKYNKVEGVYVYIHNSFPSGHATTAFAIFTALALTLENKLMKILCLAVAVTASYSRTHISQHWLSDIFFGSMLGLITATVLYLVFIDPGFSFTKKLDRPLLKK